MSDYRECMFKCGRTFRAANGYVLGRDFIACLEGKIDVSQIREICGVCIHDVAPYNSVADSGAAPRETTG